MPGLLTLTTDLKSLKYGQDRPGGGDSGQPYITVDINTNTYNEALPQLIKAGDSGTIRGGVVGAFNSSEIDRRRVEKFLYSGVQGSFFITKQVGLQLSNPRLEIPKNPRNIIQGLPENALSVGTNGLLEPTRIYNGGVNTLAQIPVTAFGRHFNKHGILVEQSEASKYEAIVTANNESTVTNQNGNNRLVSLKNKFNLGDITPNPLDSTQRLIDRANRIIAGFTNVFNTISAPLGGPRIPKFNLTPEQQIIDQYIGGPSSVYGIGQTIIRRSANTENGDEINRALDRSKQLAGYSIDDKGGRAPVNYTNDLGKGNNAISTYPGIPTGLNEIKKPLDLATYSTINTIAKDLQIKPDGTIIDPTIGVGSVNAINPLDNINVIGKDNTSYAKYRGIILKKQLTENKYNIQTEDLTESSIANAFGIYSNVSTNNLSTFLTNPGSEPTHTTIFNPNSLDYPVYYNSQTNKAVKIKIPWNKVSREDRIGSFGPTNQYPNGRHDSINLTPIFSSTSYANYNKVTLSNGQEYNVRDLVKFIIQSVNTDTPDTSVFMYFRAYLTNLSDNVDAQWSDVKYAGRGNPFYIYNGFTRKIQVGFKVAALSAEEMAPMYSKLNYLMSSLMPDYGDGNVMRGPLHRLTIGNYFDAQLGILNSLSYTVPNDSPWEIAIDEPEGGTKMLILPHILEVSMTFTPIGAERGIGANGPANRIEEKSEYISLLAQNTTGTDINDIQYYDGFNPDSILTAK